MIDARQLHGLRLARKACFAGGRAARESKPFRMRKCFRCRERTEVRQHRDFICLLLILIKIHINGIFAGETALAIAFAMGVRNNFFQAFNA